MLLVPSTEGPKPDLAGERALSTVYSVMEHPGTVADKLPHEEIEREDRLSSEVRFDRIAVAIVRVQLKVQRGGARRRVRRRGRYDIRVGMQTDGRRGRTDDGTATTR